MFSAQLSLPITKKFVAGLIAVCALFAMLGHVATTDIFQFNVDAVYDSKANDDPPFTSPFPSSRLSVSAWKIYRVGAEIVPQHHYRDTDSTEFDSHC